MQLQLEYNDQIQHKACATFIRGATPDVWLAEINSWGMVVEKMECYVMPKSISSMEAVGLFVVFKNVNDLLLKEVGNLYGVIGGKLFVPIEASLTPQVTDSELNNLLLHHRQVFHPTIGLVGFSKEDQLNLAGLFEIKKENETLWNFAKKGNAPLPKLQSIRVEQPPSDEILNSIRDAIEQRPLDEIPDPKGGKGLGSLLDDLKRGLLKGGLSASNGLRDALQNMGNAGSGNANSGGSSGGFDLFEKMGNWMQQQLDELERRRQKELDRLMNMFDTNMDEALKYAIPLDSNYLNRGTAPPSDRLGRRSTDFNLRNIGGGGRVDGWNVDNHYFELRKKYLDAAKKAEANGDFKKAAYIYAHLLGDLQEAARVLEAGKFYREAAALLKDHLKSKQAAAECLERGGLLLEAIEIFDELKKHEKVGDLYLQLGQEENAATYFEVCIEEALQRGDHIDAARLWEDKMKHREKAMETLLDGWQGAARNPERCLIKYFGIVETDDALDLETELQMIYLNKTSYIKRPAFFKVLRHINNLPEGERVRDIARDIAYEIVSEEVMDTKKTTNLYHLKNFLPKDKLIATDTSRFVNKQRRKGKNVDADIFVEYQLDKSIDWFDAVVHRNQFVILGKKENRLHLARGNWYGNFEYYSWNENINEEDIFGLYALSFHSNHIVLYSSSKLGLKDLELKRSKYFDEDLVIQCPNWLPDNVLAIGVLEKGRTAILNIINGHLALTNYENDGTLAARRDIQFNISGDWTTGRKPKELMYRASNYHTTLGNLHLKLYEDGTIEHFPLGEKPLLDFAYTNHFSDLEFAYVNEDELVVKDGLSTIHQVLDLEVAPTKINFSPNLSVSNGLVITAGKQALIFDTQGAAPELQKTIKATSSIVAVLPTVRKNRCGFLLKSGKMAVYELVE